MSGTATPDAGSADLHDEHGPDDTSAGIERRRRVWGWVVPALGLVVAAALLVLLLRPGGDDSVQVQRPEATPAPAGGDASIYATFRNTTTEPERVLGVSVTGAALTTSHRTEIGDDGLATMESGELVIPAGGELVLRPGGDHLMAEDLTDGWRPGDVVAMTVTFERAGVVQLEVPVVDPSQLASLDAIPTP